MIDDPAFAEPLPPTEFLDEAARAHGFPEWFAVPIFFQTPINRRIIVEARVLAKGGRYAPAPVTRVRRA